MKSLQKWRLCNYYRVRRNPRIKEDPAKIALSSIFDNTYTPEMCREGSLLCWKHRPCACGVITNCTSASPRLQAACGLFLFSLLKWFPLNTLKQLYEFECPQIGLPQWLPAWCGSAFHVAAHLPRTCLGADSQRATVGSAGLCQSTSQNVFIRGTPLC